MVQAIFTELGTILTQMVGLFGSVFNGVAGLFYTAGSGSEPGTLTLFGILSLISVGSGLLFFGLKWIRNLINNTEALTYYTSKYICKAGRLLKRSYYCSKGLKTSDLVLTSDNCENLIPNLNKLIINGYTSTYESDFCTIYDIPESLLPYLEKNVSIGEEIPDWILTDVDGHLEGEIIVKNQEKFNLTS